MKEALLMFYLVGMPVANGQISLLMGLVAGVLISVALVAGERAGDVLCSLLGDRLKPRSYENV